MSALVVGAVLTTLSVASTASAVDEEAPSRASGSADAGAPGIQQSYPGGGTWNYGVGPRNVYSHYGHRYSVHRATACAGRACAYSGWVSAGTLAAAAHPKAGSGNTAYWGVR